MKIINKSDAFKLPNDTLSTDYGNRGGTGGVVTTTYGG